MRTLARLHTLKQTQAKRLTYPPFTLGMLVLLLDGANFAATAYMAPDARAYATRPGVASSMLLRFGVAAGWLVVLGLAQWLWKAVVVHRFFGHPLANFVDLLFLANTSAVVLDERSSGYYLHGRNQMHHAGEWRRPRVCFNQMHHAGACARCFWWVSVCSFVFVCVLQLLPVKGPSVGAHCPTPSLWNAHAPLLTPYPQHCKQHTPQIQLSPSSTRACCGRRRASSQSAAW